MQSAVLLSQTIRRLDSRHADVMYVVRILKRVIVEICWCPDFVCILPRILPLHTNASLYGNL